MPRFMVVVGVLAIGCAATVPPDWKQVNTELLSFSAPSTLRRMPGEGIDSFAAGYEGPGLRIYFNSETLYGKPCTNPDTVRSILTGRTPPDLPWHNSHPHSAHLSVCPPGRKEVVANA